MIKELLEGMEQPNNILHKLFEDITDISILDRDEGKKTMKITTKNLDFYFFYYPEEDQWKYDGWGRNVKDLDTPLYPNQND